MFYLILKNIFFQKKNLLKQKKLIKKNLLKQFFLFTTRKNINNTKKNIKATKTY